MTDTIKIGRALLERISGVLNRLDVLSEPFAEAAELRALLAQPSEPQGGEDVEVVGHVNDIGYFRKPNGEPAGVNEPYAWEDLMTVAQHRRLMAEQLGRALAAAEVLRSADAELARAQETDDRLKARLITNKARIAISQILVAWEKNHGK